MTLIWIGLDDTDNLQSRGTGRLARQIAGDLVQAYAVCGGRLVGVTRHQLLVDPRVPYTSHNSSATIVLEIPGTADLALIFDQVRAWMLADFQPGSDPGLCVTDRVPAEVTAFGCLAQREVVTQAQARTLARQHALLLEGLGGTQDGVIGALSAVGLAASGDDGRYLLLGRLREMSGLQPVETVLQAGVSAVCTLEGRMVHEGLVQADKLRPARRGGRPVLFVEWQGESWAPLKLN